MRKDCNNCKFEGNKSGGSPCLYCTKDGSSFSSKEETTPKFNGNEVIDSILDNTTRCTIEEDKDLDDIRNFYFAYEDVVKAMKEYADKIIDATIEETKDAAYPNNWGYSGCIEYHYTDDVIKEYVLKNIINTLNQ